MKMDFLKPATLLLIMLALLWQPAFADLAAEKRPIFLTVFLHDDIPQAERQNIRRDYFVWLLKDLESVSGRRVYLDFIERQGPLTAIDYQGQNEENTLRNWTRLVDQYIAENNRPQSITHKYLVLTRNKINEYTLGLTKPGHHAAIASMATYTAPAHEIGHMLGGSHEASEVIYKDGWWCETNITPTRMGLRANCYVYSDQNRKLMLNYLSKVP
ncbi:hypothetical protein AABC73_00860 [Pseudomonas sp. G.S.17]|uniref:hypothetical protein n=1 Tax=Pseudomonas sp. G.S.17 TaxID=3137451 RepID=UPI00311C9284